MLVKTSSRLGYFSDKIQHRSHTTAKGRRMWAIALILDVIRNPFRTTQVSDRWQH